MSATRPSARLLCPCGSGKPFRKCCGKTASLAQRALRRRVTAPRLIALPNGQTFTPEQALQEGITLHKAGRFRRAAKVYRAILHAMHDHADAWNLLGVCERQQGHPEEAVRLIRRALDIQPDTALFYSNLADAYCMLGNAAEAEAAARRALALQPDLPEAYFNLGATLHLQRKTEASIEAYRTALTLRPAYLDAEIGIGDALLVARRHDEALDVYRQVSRIAPNMPSVDIRIGMALSRARRTDDAIAHYEDCVERQPRSEYYNNLALLYLQVDRAQDAIANLRKVTELTPENTTARHLLDALEGKTTERAPADYVRKLFDYYAESFETHLVDKLDYKMPQRIGDVLLQLIGVTRDLRILDLGCGTGLMGEVLQKVGGCIVGVDISTKMVDKARHKGVYSELHAQDLITYMQNCEPQRYDIITAADVFVYVGDLKAIFHEARRLLRPHGRVAFTVEALQDTDSRGFALDATGRYRHNSTYLRRLTEETGLSQEHFSPAVIRTQNDQPVHGYLCVYAKTE